MGSHNRASPRNPRKREDLGRPLADYCPETYQRCDDYFLEPGASVSLETFQLSGNAVLRPLTNRMPKCALRLLFSQRRWPAAYMSRDSEQGAVQVVAGFGGA